MAQMFNFKIGMLDLGVNRSEPNSESGGLALKSEGIEDALYNLNDKQLRDNVYRYEAYTLSISMEETPQQ